MSIDVLPQTRKRIEQRIEAGQFRSADEVVRAALDLLEERERERQQDLQRVREKIAVGLEQIERGETYDGEEVFEQLLSDLGEEES